MRSAMWSRHFGSRLSPIYCRSRPPVDLSARSLLKRRRADGLVRALGSVCAIDSTARIADRTVHLHYVDLALRAAQPAPLLSLQLSETGYCSPYERAGGYRLPVRQARRASHDRSRRLLRERYSRWSNGAWLPEPPRHAHAPFPSPRSDCESNRIRRQGEHPPVLNSQYTEKEPALLCMYGPPYRLGTPRRCRQLRPVPDVAARGHYELSLSGSSEDRKSTRLNSS